MVATLKKSLLNLSVVLDLPSIHPLLAGLPRQPKRSQTMASLIRMLSARDKKNFTLKFCPKVTTRTMPLKAKTRSSPSMITLLPGKPRGSPPIIRKPTTNSNRASQDLNPAMKNMTQRLYPAKCWMVDTSQPHFGGSLQPRSRRPTECLRLSM